jgi:hypothetical protein
MSKNLRGFEYDIVLSFAGEDRKIAEQLATELRAGKVRVFYDDWAQPDLWGKDLYQHLSHIYREAARFCVIFVSKHYAAKAWTNHELRNAQARAFQESVEYILPVKLDDTGLPGIPPTVGFIDMRHVSVSQLAELLLKKLEIGRDTPTQASSTPAPADFRIPRVPKLNVDPIQDAHDLIAHIETVLDERAPVLRDAGLAVRKETGDHGTRFYRVQYQGRLVYFLKMKVGGILGPQLVSFLDGWNEPSDGNQATAFAEVRRTLGEPDPKVSVTNFSLLEDRGVSVMLTFDQLADRIWEKACTVIEGIVNRMG